MDLICHSFRVNTIRGPFWYITNNIITIKMPIVCKSILNKVEHSQHIIEVQCHTYHKFLYLQ